MSIELNSISGTHISSVKFMGNFHHKIACSQVCQTFPFDSLNTTLDFYAKQTSCAQHGSLTCQTWNLKATIDQLSCLYDFWLPLKVYLLIQLYVDIHLASMRLVSFTLHEINDSQEITVSPLVTPSDPWPSMKYFLCQFWNFFQSKHEKLKETFLRYRVKSKVHLFRIYPLCTQMTS